MTLSAAAAAAFLGLASLLLWTLIGPGAHWPMKLTAIALTPGVAFMVWQQSRPLTGWPTHETPPAEAAFVSASVEEPTRASGGAIYVWLTPPGKQKPRAYQLPYSRPLHEQVQAALDAAKRGERVGLRRTGEKGQRGEGKGGRPGPRSPYEAYRLPPPDPGPKRKTT